MILWVYWRRLSSAIAENWLRIVVGAATGIYVAFAVCLATMMVCVAQDVRIEAVTLALFMDGVLLVGWVGGMLVAYHRRPR